MSDVPPTPIPKRLIVCCDGTWQSSVTGKRNIPSNVARLARAIAKVGRDADGKIWQQIVYYDSGVGTGSLNPIEQARQGATGDGLVVNVLEAYNFLVNNYSEGDQVFCFGFSRGAFTARAIAGLVTDIGIFKPVCMQFFAPLWALYQKNLEKHNFQKSKDYFQFINGVRPMCEKGKENEPYVRRLWEIPHHDNMSARGLAYDSSNVVEVVGVFDTVGSLGLADLKILSNASTRRRFEYLNVALSPFINHAFHAIALDEHREAFLPTLYYIPSPETLEAEGKSMNQEEKDWPELKEHRDGVDKRIKEHQSKNPPDLVQVWFPGVHINIGGGTDESSADAEGLSNITYTWMVQQLVPYLTFERWTFDVEIPEYPMRVMQENVLYESMKKDMTPEEQKEYNQHIKYNMVESIEHTLHQIMESGKKILDLQKHIEMVPIKNVTNPDTGSFLDKDGHLIVPQWGISKIEDSYTLMYYVMKSEYRSPGESTDRSRENGALLVNLGRTNEYVHPSVWWRNTQVKYHPKSLEGFERVQDPTYGSWGYYKKSTEVWIPEWFILPSDLYLGSSAIEGAKNAISGLPDQQRWQVTEWAYTDNFGDTDELQKWLVRTYIQSLQARKKMTDAGKKFPFEMPKW